MKPLPALSVGEKKITSPFLLSFQNPGIVVVSLMLSFLSCGGATFSRFSSAVISYCKKLNGTLVKH